MRGERDFSIHKLEVQYQSWRKEHWSQTCFCIQRKSVGSSVFKEQHRGGQPGSQAPVKFVGRLR